MASYSHDDEIASPTPSSTVFDGTPYVTVDHCVPGWASLENSASLKITASLRNTSHQEPLRQLIEDTTISNAERWVQSASFQLPSLAHMSSLHLPSSFFSPPAVSFALDEPFSIPSALYLSSLVQVTIGWDVQTKDEATSPSTGSLSYRSPVCWSSEAVPGIFRSSSHSACYPCVPHKASWSMNCSSERFQRSGTEFLNFSAGLSHLKSTIRKTVIRPVTLLKKRRYFADAQSAPLQAKASKSILAGELHKANDYESIDSWIYLSNTGLDTTATASQLNKPRDFLDRAASSLQCSASISRCSEDCEPSPGPTSLLLASPLLVQAQSPVYNSNCPLLSGSELSGVRSVDMFGPRSFACTDTTGKTRYEWSMPGAWSFDSLL